MSTRILSSGNDQSEQFGVLWNPFRVSVKFEADFYMK